LLPKGKKEKLKECFRTVKHKLAFDVDDESEKRKEDMLKLR
jgi:hypothetical protein